MDFFSEKIQDKIIGSKINGTDLVLPTSEMDLLVLPLALTLVHEEHLIDLPFNQIAEEIYSGIGEDTKEGFNRTRLTEYDVATLALSLKIMNIKDLRKDTDLTSVNKHIVNIYGNYIRTLEVF